MPRVSPPPARRAPPPAEAETSVRRLHVVYLAVIAVLVLIVVIVGGRAMRAFRTMRDVEEHMGLAAGVRASLPRPEALRVLTRGELLRERSFDEYRVEVDAIVERAAALGGTIEIRSTGEEGTVVRLEMATKRAETEGVEP